ILAVQDYQAKTGAARSPVEAYSSEERAAIQAEGSSRVKSGEVQPENTNSVPSQMVIKRSLSPDGRIDSISIEFSSAITEAPAAQIKNRALKTLKLQTEIVRNFLASQSNKAGGSNTAPEPKKA